MYTALIVLIIITAILLMLVVLVMLVSFRLFADPSGAVGIGVVNDLLGHRLFLLCSFSHTNSKAQRAFVSW